MAKQTKARNKELQRAEHPEMAHMISPEVSKAISGLRPEQRSVVIRAIKQESFSGPIPHPELLQKYEIVQPGFAERIVGMAERQLDHRISCEDKMIDGLVSESRRGQWFGLIVAIMFLIASVLLIILDHEVVGGILSGGVLVALVAVFVTNRPLKDNHTKGTPDPAENK